MHKWTSEEVDRLRELYKTHTREECARIMGVTLNNVKWALKKHRIFCEDKRRFVFEKGCTGWRHKPVGSEGFTGKYVKVKVAEHLWKTKQQVVWEEHYGKLNDGEVVLILNGDPKDVRIDNLMKVTKSEMLAINRNRLHSNDTEIGRTKALLGKLLAAKGKKRRSNNE